MVGKGVAKRLWALRIGFGRAGLAGAALLAVAVIAAGCETAPPRYESEPPSFAALPPLVFDLARIEVVERPAAPHPDDVDHLLPTPPAVAIGLWVRDRLRANGTTGALRVTVEEASARSTPLATNTDFEGLFTEEQQNAWTCGSASPSRRSTTMATSTAAPPPLPSAPARCRRASPSASAVGCTTRPSRPCSTTTTPARSRRSASIWGSICAEARHTGSHIGKRSPRPSEPVMDVTRRTLRP